VRHRGPNLHRIGSAAAESPSHTAAAPIRLAGRSARIPPARAGRPPSFRGARRRVVRTLNAVSRKGNAPWVPKKRAKTAGLGRAVLVGNYGSVVPVGTPRRWEHRGDRDRSSPRRAGDPHVAAGLVPDAARADDGSTAGPRCRAHLAGTGT